MSILKAILITVLSILIQILITWVVLSLTDGFDFFNGNNFQHAFGLLNIVSILISYFIIFFFFYRSIFRDKVKILRIDFDLKIVGFLLLIAVGLKFLSRPFFDFQNMIAYFQYDTIETYQYNITIKDYYSIFSGLIIAPILEELFFRKFLLMALINKYRVSASLLLSSLLFATLHITTPSNLIPSFIFGYISGIIYLKFKKIRYSILLHFFSNLFWVLMLVKGEVFYNWILEFNFGIQYWLLFILGIILTIFGMKQINNHFKKNINV